ncbi:MAG TPA: PhzF family phenazine biosynthesis isomerase [Solirubrobacteraceae bacterium]|nr:PhzF family phenazine biosynthesis isomerase [Solirubrobacteraceae bacterium]
MTTEIHRYSAFTEDAAGGNPAGVVLDASGLDDARMLAIAAKVGYSETAFLLPRGGHDYDVRYFSPEAEVPFCGHATIAAAVALADRGARGTLRLHTPVGEVPVDLATDDGRPVATLTSVDGRAEALPGADLAAALALLRWEAGDLDPALPPAIGFGGAHHLILAARTRARLAALDYDFEGLKAFMLERDLTTVDLVWREDDVTYHARNPFPVGGVVEDPATGAAAAAFGGYLRHHGLVPAGRRVTIHQGADMGRPSILLVDIPERGGIRVTGGAVPIRG